MSKDRFTLYRELLYCVCMTVNWYSAPLWQQSVDYVRSQRGVRNREGIKAKTAPVTSLVFFVFSFCLKSPVQRTSYAKSDWDFEGKTDLRINRCLTEKGDI